MVIRVQAEPMPRFRCEPLSCWISRVACAARYTFTERGDQRFAGGPCGSRCNVGRAVKAGEPLPDVFEVGVPQAVETVASRDKAWGSAECLQCGTEFKKGSGNHLYFCKRRCAKRFYRPYHPPAPGREALEAILEGY